MNSSAKPRVLKSYSRTVYWNLSFKHQDLLSSNWMPGFELDVANFYLFLLNLVSQTSEEIRTATRRNGELANKASDIDDWSQEISDFIDNFDFEGRFDGDTPELWSFSYCLENGTPQRFYAFVHQETLYPVMWDPNHRHSGGGEIPKRKTVSCSGDLACLHPKS